MSYTKRSQRKPYINIIPLVDVLTVLLFFFIVTMQFKQFKVLNITLPEIKTAGINQIDDQIVLMVDELGKIFYNGVSVSIEQLKESLIATSEMNSDLSVLIMADEGTELKIITKLMDLCRIYQFNQIRLQSR
ncbi:MAG: biopolymer transporter ExbD [Opitutae bacterium]|jgi:biopolymer transport protein ExbD|nr:biopolymer transporter ExbD [Opitutae bacterium]